MWKRAVLAGKPDSSWRAMFSVNEVQCALALEVNWRYWMNIWRWGGAAFNEQVLIIPDGDILTGNAGFIWKR